MAKALSYFLTTYNKLPYLKVMMKELLEQKTEDEEIVVVDGGSTDGTVTFLEQLLKENKIQKFISEKDEGEAHGTNRAILMCEGELLKLLTDDDVYNYAVIRKIKTFMLQNKEFDLVGTNMSYFSLSEPHKLTLKDFYADFDDWKKKEVKRFWFNGQVFMMRKKSISYLGLFDTSVKNIDTEFSLRVSSLQNIKMAWLAGISSVRIDVPESNSLKFMDTIYKNMVVIHATYRIRDEIYYGIKKNKAPLSKRIVNKFKRTILNQNLENGFVDERMTYIQTIFQATDKPNYEAAYAYLLTLLETDLFHPANFKIET